MEKEKGKHLKFRHLPYEAEEEGFEPPVPLSTAVFKTAAINRSAIPPLEPCSKLEFWP